MTDGPDQAVLHCMEVSHLSRPGTVHHLRLAVGGGASYDVGEWKDRQGVLRFGPDIATVKIGLVGWFLLQSEWSLTCY